jgi:hypothetical protein
MKNFDNEAGGDSMYELFNFNFMTNYEKLKEALEDGDLHDVKHYAKEMESEVARLRNELSGILLKIYHLALFYAAGDETISAENALMKLYDDIEKNASSNSAINKDLKQNSWHKEMNACDYGHSPRKKIYENTKR